MLAHNLTMKQTKKQNISQIIGLVMKITSSEKSNILIVIVFLLRFCQKHFGDIDSNKPVSFQRPFHLLLTLTPHQFKMCFHFILLVKKKVCKSI